MSAEKVEGYALFRHRLEAYAPVPVATVVRTSSFDARSKRGGSPQSCFELRNGA
jgi:hypothetical protein